MSEEIDLNKQTILAAIPIPPIQIYAFYKIKKTIIGTVILLGVYHQIILDFINPTLDIPYIFEPNPLFFAYLGIMVYFVRRWTKQYNAKTTSTEA